MRSTKRATQIADRRRRVAEAYLRGTPQYKIAEAEGVHNGQISRDLVAIREEWKATASVAFGERIATELAKLDELERTYWDAWERSKREGDSGRHQQPIPAAEQTATVGPEGLAGDPRFLAGVESCIDKRCKILGLYNQKVEHSGSVGIGMLVIEVEKDASTAGHDAGKLLPAPTNPTSGSSGQVIRIVRNGSAA